MPCQPPPTRTLTSTQTVTAGMLELELFADWHGDGAKQKDEPAIKDAILELSGEGTKIIWRCRRPVFRCCLYLRGCRL